MGTSCSSCSSAVHDDDTNGNKKSRSRRGPEGGAQQPHSQHVQQQPAQQNAHNNQLSTTAAVQFHNRIEAPSTSCTPSAIVPSAEPRSTKSSPTLPKEKRSRDGSTAPSEQKYCCVGDNDDNVEAVAVHNVTESISAEPPPSVPGIHQRDTGDTKHNQKQQQQLRSSHRNISADNNDNGSVVKNAHNNTFANNSTSDVATTTRGDEAARTSDRKKTTSSGQRERQSLTSQENDAVARLLTSQQQRPQGPTQLPQTAPVLLINSFVVANNNSNETPTGITGDGTGGILNKSTSNTSNINNKSNNNINNNNNNNNNSDNNNDARCSIRNEGALNNDPSSTGCAKSPTLHLNNNNLSSIGAANGSCSITPAASTHRPRMSLPLHSNNNNNNNNNASASVLSTNDKSSFSSRRPRQSTPSQQRKTRNELSESAAASDAKVNSMHRSNENTHRTPGSPLNLQQHQTSDTLCRAIQQVGGFPQQQQQPRRRPKKGIPGEAQADDDDDDVDDDGQDATSTPSSNDEAADANERYCASDVFDEAEEYDEQLHMPHSIVREKLANYSKQFNRPHQQSRETESTNNNNNNNVNNVNNNSNHNNHTRGAPSSSSKRQHRVKKNKPQSSASGATTGTTTNNNSSSNNNNNNSTVDGEKRHAQHQRRSPQNDRIGAFGSGVLVGAEATTMTAKITSTAGFVALHQSCSEQQQKQIAHHGTASSSSHPLSNSNPSNNNNNNKHTSNNYISDNNNNNNSKNKSKNKTNNDNGNKTDESLKLQQLEHLKSLGLFEGGTSSHHRNNNNTNHNNHNNNAEDDAPNNNNTTNSNKNNNNNTSVLPTAMAGHVTIDNTKVLALGNRRMSLINQSPNRNRPPLGNASLLNNNNNNTNDSCSNNTNNINNNINNNSGIGVACGGKTDRKNGGRGSPVGGVASKSDSHRLSPASVASGNNIANGQKQKRTTSPKSPHSRSMPTKRKTNHNSPTVVLPVQGNPNVVLVVTDDSAQAEPRIRAPRRMSDYPQQQEHDDDDDDDGDGDRRHRQTGSQNREVASDEEPEERERILLANVAARARVTTDAVAGPCAATLGLVGSGSNHNKHNPFAEPQLAPVAQHQQPNPRRRKPTDVHLQLRTIATTSAEVIARGSATAGGGGGGGGRRNIIGESNNQQSFSHHQHPNIHHYHHHHQHHHHQSQPQQHQLQIQHQDNHHHVETTSNQIGGQPGGPFAAPAHTRLDFLPPLGVKLDSDSVAGAVMNLVHAGHRVQHNQHHRHDRNHNDDDDDLNGVVVTLLHRRSRSNDDHDNNDNHKMNSYANLNEFAASGLREEVSPVQHTAVTPSPISSSNRPHCTLFRQHHHPHTLSNTISESPQQQPLPRPNHNVAVVVRQGQHSVVQGQGDDDGGDECQLNVVQVGDDKQREDQILTIPPEQREPKDQDSQQPPQSVLNQVSLDQLMKSLGLFRKSNTPPAIFGQQRDQHHSHHQQDEQEEHEHEQHHQQHEPSAPYTPPNHDERLKTWVREQSEILKEYRKKKLSLPGHLNDEDS